MKQFLFELLFEEENGSTLREIDYKIRGYGKGYPKSGSRKNVKRSGYFQQDLFTVFLTNLGEKKFTAKFAGFKPHEIISFFGAVRMHYLRPNETLEHARNKLLLWLDWLHNSLSYAQVSEYYDIGISTAVEYLREVPRGICSAYQGSQVISLPPKSVRHKIVESLKKQNRPMWHVVFLCDGSHPRCNGYKTHPERLSWKHNFEPAFNVTFVIERGLKTIVAYNLDPSCHKHDIKMLAESEFYRTMKEQLGEWVLLADKGYVGFEPGYVAAIPRETDKERNWYPKKLWKVLNSARADVEVAFSHFFFNKFKLLANWPGKACDTFVHWSTNVTACIIIYNATKLRLYSW